jgi:hypothetical protein
MGLGTGELSRDVSSGVRIGAMILFIQRNSAANFFDEKSPDRECGSLLRWRGFVISFLLARRDDSGAGALEPV